MILGNAKILAMVAMEAIFLVIILKTKVVPLFEIMVIRMIEMEAMQ